LTNQVSADVSSANAAGFNSTPTLVVTGPKSQAQPLVGDQTYGTMETTIQSVS
jgi:protein-disulfide isomerase